VARLIVANNHGHGTIGDAGRLTPERKAVRPIVASRLVWLLREGDVLLLPRMPSDAFLGYALDVLGLARNAVDVVIPPESIVDPAGPSLSAGVLRSPEVRDLLRPLVRDRCDRVFAYHFEESVCELVTSLGMPLTSHERAFVESGAPWRLNSKVAFRELAAAAGARLAPGAVARGEAELLAAIRDLVDLTGSVIVKQDRNTAGWGNIVITRDPVEKGIGAGETRWFDEPAALAGIAAEVWRQLVDRVNEALVVEAFYPASDSYYTEVEVWPGPGRLRLVGLGEQRMEPVWVGFEIPARSLAVGEIAELVSVSMALGDVARALGFSTVLSVDAIRGEDGMIVNELNARVSGCTHIHDIAERLVGANFMDRCAILTRNTQPAGQFPDLLAELSRRRLLYRSRDGEGILVMADDTAWTGTIGYMVIAGSYERARAIEWEGRALMAASATREEEVRT
jgi:Pre ATP-grasp domain/PGM1 C-terminal domain